MTAAEQRRYAARLAAALTHAGLVIERADVVGGNVTGWAAIPPEALLGRLLTLGWRVRETGGVDTPVTPLHARIRTPEVTT